MRVPALPPASRPPAVADDTRTCYACGFETDEPLMACPSCGSRRFRTGRAVRRLGWALVVLGGLLVALMGALSWIVAQVIVHNGAPGTTTTFTGGPEEVALIAGVFGFVIALGIAFVFGGAWQIRYGRPNRTLMAIMFVVALALLFLSKSRPLIGL